MRTPRSLGPELRVVCAALLLLAPVLASGAADTTLAGVERRKHDYLVRWANKWRDSGYTMEPDPREWKWDEYDPTWYGALASMKLKRSALEVAKANEYFAGMTEGPTMRAIEAIHTLYLFKDDPDLSDAARGRLWYLTVDTPAPKRINPSVWQYGATENIAIMGHVWYLLAAQLKGDRVGQAQMEDHLCKFIDAHFRMGWVEFYSPCYMEKVTGALMMLTQWAESPRVRRKARALLDLMFAEYAANNVDQVMAAPCTRAYGYEPIPANGELGHNERRDFSCSGIYSMGYVLFGTGRMVDYGVLGTPVLVTCDYVPPEIVLEISAAERGTYVFRARKPGLNVSRFGLAPNVPEPPYSARIICLHTPNFVLAATQEVNYVYSAMRYNTMNSVLFLPGNPRKVIFTEFGEAKGGNYGVSIDLVQHDGVQIGKGSAGLAYFPRDLLQELVEEDGWIFVRDGGTFAAYKVVEGGYSWRGVSSPSVYGDYIEFERQDSAFILHVCPASDYGGDFSAFRQDIADNIVLRTSDGVKYVTSGPNGFLLELRPGKPADAVGEERNYARCLGKLPRLNGQEIDLENYHGIECPFLFQKPNDRYAVIKLGGKRLRIGVGP